MKKKELPKLSLSPNSSQLEESKSFLHKRFSLPKKKSRANTKSLFTLTPIMNYNRLAVHNHSTNKRLFKTQNYNSTISSFSITKSTSFNLTKRKIDSNDLKTNKIRLLKRKIKDSCQDIDKNCLTLNSNMYNNPIFIDNGHSNFTFTKQSNDITMKSIKDEISSLGKEINKKGFFITISDPNKPKKKNEDPNKLSKIFISENPNNIFNRTSLAEKMNPCSVLKFRNKMNKDFNLNLRTKTIKKEEKQPYVSFLRAYNREIVYAKHIGEQYNIKTNDKACYLFTL